jgi:Neurotransmitter-gated ion-channel ligand binding domain/Neurotransmitter-gated ion-channel transmembrane region
MKRIVFLPVVFVAMSIQIVRSAEAPPLIERPGAANRPTQVSVGIWIVDINNIDSAQQNFTADIAIVLRWKDARLAHTGTGAVHHALDQIWTPRVSIANETNSVVRKLPESAEVEPDGTVLYRQRYVGSFTQPLRLQSFPFDRQDFRIQFVAIRYRPDEVAFVPDENWIRNGLQQGAGISQSITLPDWTVEKWDAKASVYSLTPGLQYSGYVFEFTASRNVEHYILKVILPLVLIVMMSWSVFWTEPTNSNTQFSIAVTSMLTLIAYRFAVDTQLPRLPYMTRLDVFFLVSTLLVFLSLIEVLVTTILDNNHQVARAKKLDRYCRVIVPVIFIIASIAIFAHPRG